MERRIFCPRLLDGNHLRHNVLLNLRAGRIDAIVEGGGRSRFCRAVAGCARWRWVDER